MSTLKRSRDDIQIVEDKKIKAEENGENHTDLENQPPVNIPEAPKQESKVVTPKKPRKVYLWKN
jgi:hypothetical protein